jgi:hypothetical protein
MYAGTDSVVLTYTCGLPDGPQKSGADLMRVGADNTIVEWRCHLTHRLASASSGSSGDREAKPHRTPRRERT